jgi:hypothetical protein
MNGIDRFHFERIIQWYTQHPAVPPTQICHGKGLTNQYDSSLLPDSAGVIKVYVNVDREFLLYSEL